MIVINSYDEIKSKDIQVGEKFEIHKGKLMATYKVIRSENFEDCYELLRCTDFHTNKHVTGCGSVVGCIQLAYDVT